MTSKTAAHRYARALFEVARAEGNIDVVEDELHRFKVAFSGSDELRVALTDSQIPAAKRQAISTMRAAGRTISFDPNLRPTRPASGDPG